MTHRLARVVSPQDGVEHVASAHRVGPTERADKVSGTDFGQIGGRKPFSVPDTFSVSGQFGGRVCLG